jgi:hypothetical protein
MVYLKINWETAVPTRQYPVWVKCTITRLGQGYINLYGKVYIGNSVFQGKDFAKNRF